ncbi:MAG TPA: hypothetical protein DCO67_04590 [Staphylococcus sp.]|nr:hypothetical protein [Staphylococcus sp.]
MLMDKQRRLQKFSIRKYTVGTCSILIGTLIFLGVPTHDAFASENDANILKHEDSLNDKGKDVVEDNTNNSDSANKDKASDLSSDSVPNNVETSEVEPTNDDHLSESTEQENHAEVEVPSEEHSSEATAKEAHTEENHETLAEQNAKVNHEENNQSDESTAPQDHQELENKDAVKQQSGKNVETSDNKRNEHESSQDIEADNDSVESEDDNNAEDNDNNDNAENIDQNKDDELAMPSHQIPVVNVHQLTEQEKTRVKKAVISTNKSLSESMITVGEDGSVIVNNNGKTYKLPAYITVFQAEPLEHRTDLRIGETGTFNKGFGRNVSDATVSRAVLVENITTTERGNFVDYIYTIQYNPSHGRDVRGRFYFYAPEGVELTAGGVEQLSGRGKEPRWARNAKTFGSKLNAMVYQATSPEENEYYRNLTDIKAENNYYMLSEGIDYSGNSYRAYMTATVSKEWLKQHGNKFYVAVGVATRNSVRENNRVRFIQNQYNPNSNNSNINDKNKPLGLREHYNISWERQNLPNRPLDPGFELSPDGKTLIYKYAIGHKPDQNINTDELLSLLKATAKDNANNVLHGTVKKKAERGENGYSLGTAATNDEGQYILTKLNPRDHTTSRYNIPVLDIIQPVGGSNGNYLLGGRVINIEGSGEGQDGVINKDKYNRVVSGFEIDAANNNGGGDASFSDPRIIRGAAGTNDIAKDNSAGVRVNNNYEGKTRAINKFQIYASYKQLAYLSNLNPETETNVMNLFVVPVDVTKPTVLPNETRSAISVPSVISSKEALDRFLADGAAKIVGKDNFSTNAHLTKELKVYDENDNEILLDEDNIPKNTNYKVKAFVTDEAGNTSEPLELGTLFYKVIPNQPEIVTDLTQKAAKPVVQDPIEVRSQPGSTVNLYDKDNHIIGSAVANDNGIATITPAQPIPEGNVTAKATDRAERPNTSEMSDPIKATDTTAPNKPVIRTPLAGKAGTTDPVDVQAEPGSKVTLFDKDNHKLGEAETGNDGIAHVTPTKAIPEGNVTAKATDKAETPNTSAPSDPIKATDTTPPAKPVINTRLTGKAGTQDEIEVKTEPHAKVELFDKDGHKLGEGEAGPRGIASITPTRPIPEGNVTDKATDKAETPNTSQASDPKKATDTTAPAKPVITTPF